jgi:UDP-N-acetylglucosamine--N-acetylmuramyl-(pentapeptide) pyrophosphoryl-undecaprenol N-acetylglucosamine transferase
MAAERRGESNANRYVLFAYLDDMAPAYAAADIALTRSGASTIAELAITGVPAILVPYPYAAQDHQRKNAQLFAQAGAAVMLDDAGLSGDALYWLLRRLIEQDKLGAMRAAVRSLAQPRALHLMVERILAPTA